MNLAQFPRRRYTEGYTPLEFLPHLTEAIGGPNIYMKRDDMLGLTSGGNKTRKLEFVMADALAKGADTIITCGAVQSNHCRLTLAAAVKEGLKCQLVLEERVKDSYNPTGSGNNFLYNLLGCEAVRVVSGGTDMMKAMGELAAELEKKGRKPYVVPGGASDDIGGLGYVSCAQEVLTQLFDKGLKIDCIFTPSGSAGTHAGLLTGMIGENANIPVIGIGVNKPKAVQTQNVYNLCQKLSTKLGMKNEVRMEDVVVYDDYVGPGYSLPTDGMVEAVKLVARTEGILLDPVYSGKAMDGTLDLLRKGMFKKGQNVLFLHTGGSPALYAYIDPILKGEHAPRV